MKAIELLDEYINESIIIQNEIDSEAFNNDAYVAHLWERIRNQERISATEVDIHSKAMSFMFTILFESIKLGKINTDKVEKLQEVMYAYDLWPEFADEEVFK